MQHNNQLRSEAIRNGDYEVFFNAGNTNLGIGLLLLAGMFALPGESLPSIGLRLSFATLACCFAMYAGQNYRFGLQAKKNA